MSTSENTVLGAIKFLTNLKNQCFTSWEDFLAWFQENTAIVLPVSGLTNVVISNLQPATNSTGVIWFKLNSGGNFVGIFIFSGGGWIQMFPPPHGVFRTYGDSRTPDPGYQFITTDTPGFTPDMVTFLQTQWLLDPTSTFYVLFDTVFVGT